MQDMNSFIGYGRQTIEDDDVAAVVDALKGDFLTQGPRLEGFEAALADHVGARFAVAVSNGTAALHIACIAAGMQPGDHGVTQAITFVASANCMVYCGASAGLVDIDADTINMSADGLSAYLRDKPETKVVIPVSMGGLSAGADALREIAGKRIIIEDASHSCGATYVGTRDKVGTVGCAADMTTFSFHPVKPFTTGEGGAVVTNDEDLYRHLLEARSHGIVRQADRLVRAQGAHEPWYYEQQTLGYNYRLTDLQAALGHSQIRKLDRFLDRRREIALRYDEAFSALEHVTLVQSAPDQRAASGHHLYVLSIDFEALGTDRASVISELRARKIGTQVHYIPVYMQPFYRELADDPARQFPNSEAYYARCLTIPCFPTMEDADVERVIDSLRAVLAGV